MSDPLRTTTGRRRRRSATHAEGGQSLVVVLAMSLIILSLAGIAIQVTVVDGAATGTYVNTVQSRLAAETGINATLAGITAATTPAGLVNTLSYTATVKPLWSYVTTLTYATSTGSALTVPLSVWPATAEITPSRIPSIIEPCRPVAAIAPTRPPNPILASSGNGAVRFGVCGSLSPINSPTASTVKTTAVTSLVVQNAQVRCTGRS